MITLRAPRTACLSPLICLSALPAPSRSVRVSATRVRALACWRSLSRSITSEEDKRAAESAGGDEGEPQSDKAAAKPRSGRFRGGDWLAD